MAQETYIHGASALFLPFDRGNEFLDLNHVGVCSRDFLLNILDPIRVISGYVDQVHVMVLRPHLQERGSAACTGTCTGRPCTGVSALSMDLHVTYIVLISQPKLFEVIVVDLHTHHRTAEREDLCQSRMPPVDTT